MIISRSSGVFTVRIRLGNVRCTGGRGTAWPATGIHGYEDGHTGVLHETVPKADRGSLFHETVSLS